MKGRPPAYIPQPTESDDKTVSALAGGVTDSNMSKNAIGFGDMAHGSGVGKQRAVWSHVSMLTGTSGEYEVSHSLGAVPVFCRLWELRPPPGATGVLPTANAVPVKKNLWTKTTARVYVVATSSTLGCTAVFMVGGE